MLLYFLGVIPKGFENRNFDSRSKVFALKISVCVDVWNQLLKALSVICLLSKLKRIMTKSNI